MAGSSNSLDKERETAELSGTNACNEEILKTLRSVMILMEKNKQAETDAELIRKNQIAELQEEIKEENLSLVQLQHRLSELKNRRIELEEAKRYLMSHEEKNDNNCQVTNMLTTPESQPK